MSQGKNDDYMALNNFMKAIIGKINDGDRRITDLFSTARIYKVPEYLRKLNESAYTPRVIAMGPIHREDKHLQNPMEHVKRYYTLQLLARLTSGKEDEVQKGNKMVEVLKQCAGKMKEEESVHKARKYYSAELMVEDDQLSEMMLFDGCFILELLCCYHNKKTKEAGKSTTKGGGSGNSKASSSGDDEQMADPILDNIVTANNVKHDLLLFENQIPFFVLDELFKLTVDKIPEDQVTGGKKLSLIDYVVSYFEDVMFPPGHKIGDCVLSISSSRNEIEQGEKLSRKANDYIHIFHLLHSRCLPVPGGQMENKKHSEIKLSDLRISASDLDYAGIKLEGKERSLSNITFEGGNFEIPVIRVHGSTEAILRNLIAFEQCCPWVSQHYFTSYAIFMDMLINSEKDVQVLKNANIIENYLGTDKYVFDLFNNLCKEIVTEDFYFSEVCQRASNFTKRNLWPILIAYVKRMYFASPWGFVNGFFSGFVAFEMSLAQFVKGFYK